MADPELPDLRQWLRNHPDPAAEITLTREGAAALADALSHSRQSADRLKRQNAKLRRRIERLKAGQPDLDDAPTGAEPPNSTGPDGDSSPD